MQALLARMYRQAAVEANALANGVDPRHRDLGLSSLTLRASPARAVAPVRWPA